jgi:membrane protease YdiL (CAAX protease family)
LVVGGVEGIREAALRELDGLAESKRLGEVGAAERDKILGARVVLAAELHEGDLSAAPVEMAVSETSRDSQGLIRAAYGGGPLPIPLRSILALRKPGWTTDTLVIRIAEASGDVASAKMIREEQLARGSHLVRSLAVRHFGYWSIIVLGVAVAALRWRRIQELRCELSSRRRLPLPRSALGVFAICMAVAAIGDAGVRHLVIPSLVELSSESGLRWVQDYWTLFVTVISLAVLLHLSRRHVLRDSEGALARATGVPGDRRLASLISAGAALAVIYWMGFSVGGAVADGLGIGTEAGMLPRGPTGSLPGIARSAGILLVGPVLEEMLYRWLLYGALRRWMGPLLAAVASALVFSFAHSAPLAHHAQMIWVGILLALAYEALGSIVPGVVAHALINLRAVLAV